MLSLFNFSFDQFGEIKYLFHVTSTIFFLFDRLIFKDSEA